MRTKTHISGTRTYTAPLLVVVLVSFAMVATASPTLLYAAPSMGAGPGVSQSRIVTDDGPTNFVSRGRLAQQVANAAGFDEDPGEQIFEDVPPDSHYYQWVNRLANRGVIGGFLCGTRDDEPCVSPLDRPYFRPDADATRGQIAKVISVSAGFDDAPVGETFEDVPPGSTFYDFVERLASRGLISGYECGVSPAGPCVEPDNRPYFRPFDRMAMSDLVKVVNDTFHRED